MMRKIWCCGLFVLLTAVSSSAKSVHHYVFFGMDREIIEFGKSYLGADYIFWCTEEPYYSERLILFMKRNVKP